MPFESLLTLFIIILWDSQLIKKYDRQHFLKVFSVSKYILFSLILISTILVGFFDEASSYISYLFLAFVIPLYLSKRNLFLYTDFNKPQQYLNGHDKPTRAYTVFEGFKVIILSLFGTVVFSIVFNGMLKYTAIELSAINHLMISIVFWTVLMFVLIAKSSSTFSPRGFWYNVGFIWEKSLLKSVVIPIFVGIFFVGMASYITISRGDNHPVTPLTETLSTANSVGIILIFVIWAWFIAPIFEEIVFRGYFFHILKKSRGPLFAIYAISFSFAFLHVGQYWGDWMAILMVTLMGFALTILRAWSGTAIASFITHIIYNIGVTVVPIVIMSMSNPAYFEYQTKFAHLDASQKEELLIESIEQRPDLSMAYNDLAWLYSEENIKLDEAMDLINKALSMSEDNQAYLDTKAEILELQNQYQEALQIREELFDRTLTESSEQYQEERIIELKRLIEEE